jgi:hypothetical protein
MTGDRWELVGDDAEAMCHDGHLPLDWRSKARALQAHDDKTCALSCFPLSSLPIAHGWEIFAPPESEWWGGTILATTPSPNTPPQGWCWSDTPHEDCCGPEPVDGDTEPCAWADVEGVQCHALDPSADIAKVAANAPPEVKCIVTRHGDEWLCRIVGPVTVVDLR